MAHGSRPALVAPCQRMPTAVAAVAAAGPAVLVEAAGQVAVITFNRPLKLNAWSTELIEGWQAALDAVAADPALSAAVLTGNGRYYCSGVDFGGVLTRPMLPSKLIKVAAAANYELFDAFIRFPKPLIAAVCRLPPAIPLLFRGHRRPNDSIIGAPAGQRPSDWRSSHLPRTLRCSCGR